MNLYQVEHAAKDMVVELHPNNGQIGFRAMFPTGPVVLLWLDPYMGLLQIPGKKEFFMTRELAGAFPALECDPPKVFTVEEIEGLALVTRFLLPAKEAPNERV